MRRIAILTAVIAISTVPSHAFDLGRLADRLTDCDGPGVALMQRYAPTLDATSADEADGYSALEIIEMLISEDGEADGSLRDAARESIALVKGAAVRGAADIIAECGLEASVPTHSTVPNPFLPN